MSYAYQIHKQDAAYFLTMTVVEWADALMRPEHKIIVCDSLNFCVKHKGLEIFAYVIMSSHIHMIARAKNGNLSDIVRDFKKFTSSKLLKEFESGRESRKEWLIGIFEKGGAKQSKKSNFQLWQYNNHAEEVFGPKFTLSKVMYIHLNPVEAGLVSRAENYMYSSAIDYSGGVGPVQVSVMNLHNLYY